MLFVSLGAFALATIVVNGGLLQHNWKINTGNTNSTVSGKSTCVAHNLTVAATSDNFKLLFPEPANQVAATESVVELLQTNSSSFARANAGQKIITGNYNIYGQFCFSSDSEAAKHVQTIQFLTHGDTLDSTYWDIAPGYSYIDAAIGAGYATFSYDRIGVGKSDHPDPIQIVQGPLQVEIAHALVTLIRSTQIEKQSFKNVVGVGHSAGSTVTQGVTTKYPQDFDAVILTGTSISANYVTAALASFDLTIANTDASGRFAGLSNGYLVQPIQQSIQFPYYRFPNFDPKSKFSLPLSLTSALLSSIQTSRWESQTNKPRPSVSSSR